MPDLISPAFHSLHWRSTPHAARFPARALAACAQAACALAALTLTACAAADDGERDGAAGSDPAAVVGDAAPRAGLDLPIIAQEAREGDLILRVNTKGAVYGDANVRLSSEVSGTVAELLVRPGARVAKGQPLVRLDAYPFDLDVRAAQADLDQRQQAFLESFVPESLVTGIGPNEEQRRALRIRGGLPAAEVALERAEYARENATIVSPVSGYVDRIDVAVGERVAAGGAVATIVDLGALRIEAQVLEHDLPLIRVGGEAMVTSAAVPGRAMRGRIDAVLPMVDSVTRIGRAIIRVPGETVLRPGMYADVQLEAQRLPDRIMVPAKAVIERDGRPVVFVVKEGRAQWTYIQPGRSNGVDTEVLPDSSSGIIPIAAGDQIIVEGQLTLTHDARVSVAAVREIAVPAGGAPAMRPEDD